MKTKTFLSDLTPPRHTGLLAKFFALFFCLAMGMNVWGADPDYSSYDWSSDDAATVVGTHGDVTIGGALGSSGNVNGHYYLPISANLKNSDNPWNGYMSISSTKQIEKIEILYCPNGTNQTSVAWAAWGSGVTPNQITLAHGVTVGTKSSKAWDNAVWETIDLSETEAYTVYLSRSIREFKDKDEQTISNFGGGQTINVLGIKVWLASSDDCTPLAVNFAAGEGTGTMTAGECCPTKTYTIPACGFTAPAGKEFDAWTSSPEVTITDGKFTMPDEAVTLTATWRDVPQVNFSLTVTNGYTETVASKATHDITASEATISGGTASLYNGAGSAKAVMTATAISLSGSSSYLKITFADGAKLFPGCMIKVDTKNTFKLTATNSSSNALNTNAETGAYTVTATDILNGSNTLYVWKNGGSTFTTIKVSVPVYKSVSFVAGDAEATGSMDAVDVEVGEEYTIPTCSFEVAGKDFNGWTTSDVVIADGKFTMPNNNVTLTASWVAAATKYTVTYMDGTDEISHEEVAEGEKAANVPTPKKELYHFAGWEDAEHNAIDFTTLEVRAAVTAYAKWTLYDFATSINIETYAKSDPNTNVKGQLDAANIAYSGVDNGNIDKTTDNNGAYAGIKLKSASAYLTFRADANKRVTVKLGYMAAGAHMTINGVNDTKYSNNLTGGSTSSGDNFVDYYWDTNTETIFKLTMTTGSTCVIKAITIADIPAQSNDASLATLTLNGETIEGFTSTKQNYTITLPYGTTALPEVAATATDANATVSSPIQVSGTLGENNLQYDWHVTAEDGTIKYYRINFTVAPKLGAEIIKATITGNSTATASGLYAGSVATLNSSKKLGNNGDYVKFVLMAGETFATGDVLAFDVTLPNGGNKIYITSDAPAKANASSATILSTLDHIFAEGMNYITLPEAINGLSEFYLYRVDSKFNPTINSASVLRQMPSIIKSFTIGEAEGVIDQENKTIAVSVPFGTDVTALTPVVEAYANGGATVTPTTAQNFSSAKTYTVTSAYSEDDAVSYVVTVTVAEPACPTEVTISGEKTYTDGATIELTATTDGTGTITYQWYKDEVAIDGATTATFSKTATMTDGGNYVCKVNQGTCEEVASEAYAVVVNKVKVTGITFSEVPAEIKAGESFELTATVAPANATYPEVTWRSDKNNEIPYFSVTEGNPTTVTGLVACSSAKKVYAKADDYSEKSVSLKVYYEVSFANCDPIEAMKFFNSGLTLPAAPTGGNAPFLGWYDNAEFTGSAITGSYKPAGNVTLYAKWTMPDAETPTITTQPVGATYDEGDPIAPLTVVATVTDGGVLSYQWYNGTAAIDGATDAEYTPTEAGKYKVVVTNTLVDHNPASETSEVAEVTINRTYVQTDVTGSVTWDWSKSSVALLNDTYTDQLLAELIPETATFATSNLVISTNGKAYAVRDTKYAQVSKIKFHTTVPGFITVKFSDTGSSSRSDSEEFYRYLYVNGVKTQYYSFGTSASAHGLFTTGNIFVSEGDVELSFKKQDAATNCNVYIITFTETSFDATIRSGLTNGKLVTMCQAKSIKAMDGAVPFEVEKATAIGIDLVEATFPLVAGKPYILEANKAEVRVVYGSGEAATAVVAANGLIGNLSTAGANMDIPTWTVAEQYYIFQNNHICKTSTGNYIAPDRAYLRKDLVNAVAPAPGRRRISMTTDDVNTPTGLDALMQQADIQKVMIDGHVYIIREGKMFNAVGQMVK